MSGLWDVDAPRKANSNCKRCEQPIEAGDIRFRWCPPDKHQKDYFHLHCAAQASPDGLAPVNKNTVRKALGLSQTQREQLTAVLEAPKKAARAALLRASRSTSHSKRTAAKKAETRVARSAAKGALPGRQPASKKTTQGLSDAGSAGKARRGGKSKLREELREFEKCKAAMQGWTTEKLKALLKANDQSRTGNKAVLLAKAADGEAFGKLPRCPKCHGGRIKFRLPAPDGSLQSLFRLYGGAYGQDKADDEKEHKLRVKRRFYCTGYVDDADKVDCAWQADQVERENWTSKT